MARDIQSSNDRLSSRRKRWPWAVAPVVMIAGVVSATLLSGTTTALTGTVGTVGGTGGTVASGLVGGILNGGVAGAGTAPCEMTRTGEYPRASATATGFDPAKLQAALDYAALMGSHTIKVFRHGCLVGEGLRDPLFDRVPDDNWGQTKTIVALLTGIAADKGFVNLDAPIGENFPDGLGDAAHRAVTLRQLLWASSGAEVNQVRGLNFFADVSRVRDWLAQPITRSPGTYYFYDQTATSVIVYVIERAMAKAGKPMDFQDFAQSYLFDNLGIPKSSYFWQRDRSGTTSGYSQLFMRPLEFGRFGELIRRNGAFQDKQVVSTGYMAQLSTPHQPTAAIPT